VTEYEVPGASHFQSTHPTGNSDGVVCGIDVLECARRHAYSKLLVSYWLSSS
jgi:hypothetical protein